MKPVIVYVDDEPRNLTVFEATVPEDWDLHCFENAADALKKIKSISPWVVLSDQKMPFMSGLEFLEVVAQLSPDTVRIVVTGQTEERTIIQLIRRAKVYDYVTKPWDSDDFLSRIEKAIDYYRISTERNSIYEALGAKNREIEKQNYDLIVMTDQLKKAQQREIELRREVESLVPTPLVRAIQNGNISFPFRRDLTCIVFDIINSSAIHGVEVRGRSLRSHVLRLFTEALLRNGGIRECHGGDSAYGHFGAFDNVTAPAAAAIATAKEFRVALRSLCRANDVKVECGIALHVVSQALLDLHEIKVETESGPLVMKSYDSSSPQIDLVHRFEKLSHELPGSNIIMSEEFFALLPDIEKAPVKLGKFTFKGVAQEIMLFLMPSDLVTEESIQKLVEKNGNPEGGLKIIRAS